MSVRPFLFIAMICTVSAFHSNRAVADEPTSSNDVTSPAAATQPGEAPFTELTPEQLEKRKRAYIGLVAVAGIVIIGVALAALTILWAGRLRRQLRQTDPACAPLDRSFWFLKPPKRLVTRSSLPEQQFPGNSLPPNTPPESDTL